MYFVNILVVFLSSIFIISGSMKIFRLNTFVELVKSYEVLPRNLAVVYGGLLPVIEIATALLLFFDIFFLTTVSIIILMLISFYIAISKVIKSKKVITCGCYGKFNDSKADMFTLIKIVFLIFAALLVVVFRDRGLNLSIAPLDILIGSLLSLLIFIFQRGWNYYQENLELIKKSY